MQTLDELITPLPANDRQALVWFQEHQGKEISWPQPLANGLFLVNKAKGIHKPKGWRYALSVRQTIDGPYSDLDPERLANGGWNYRYFQEGMNPSDRDHYFTDQALMACMTDVVPIGVLRQTRGRPDPRYTVLGLALVRDWKEQIFRSRRSCKAPASRQRLSEETN